MIRYFFACLRSETHLDDLYSFVEFTIETISGLLALFAVDIGISEAVINNRE
jgi:hypothetical protein